MAEPTIQKLHTPLVEDDIRRRARLGSDLEVARIALSRSIFERLSLTTELELTEAYIKHYGAAAAAASPRDALEFASQITVLRAKATALEAVLASKQTLERHRQHLYEMMYAAVEGSERMPDAMHWALAALPVDSETFKELTTPHEERKK